MALIEAYFDESYGKVQGRRILCVAGYLMTDRAARRLTKAWQSILDEYTLPYFHMVDCAHGNGPFGALTKQQRIDVQTRMIEQIKRRTILGMAVTIDEGEFERFMPKSPLIGGPYTFCVHVIIGGVVHWISENKGQDDIAYFFEAGHLSQREANGVMEIIFHEPELKSATRYADHAFVEKEKVPPVQAADLLAWQWYTQTRHQIEGRAMRKDCASLLKHEHITVHVPARKIMELASKWTGVRYLVDLKALGVLRDVSCRAARLEPGS